MKLILEIAIIETHFLIKGTFYDQVDGIAMGPPLAPNLSDLFMRHHENKINSENSTGIQKFYSITTKWMKRFVFSTLSKMLPFSLITLTHNTLLYTLQWRGNRSHLTTDHEEFGNKEFIVTQSKRRKLH